MIFTRFRSSPSSSSSWFYALVSTLYPYATTSITVSKTWLYSIFFSLFLPPFQGTSYFFPLYLHLSSASLSLFFLFHLSQSFVLSTPTDIEFSSRRINFSFLLSAIPYWLMYPSVSSCSRFLFIVPRTPSIFQRLAVGRFYFSLPPPPILPSHFSILPARNPPDTDPIMNIQISRRGLAGGARDARYKNLRAMDFPIPDVGELDVSSITLTIPLDIYLLATV